MECVGCQEVVVQDLGNGFFGCFEQVWVEIGVGWVVSVENYLFIWMMIGKGDDVGSKKVGYYFVQFGLDILVVGQIGQILGGFDYGIEMQFLVGNWFVYQVYCNG